MEDFQHSATVWGRAWLCSQGQKRTGAGKKCRVPEVNIFRQIGDFMQFDVDSSKSWLFVNGLVMDCEQTLRELSVDVISLLNICVKRELCE